jgi:hypothetical protein
MGMRRKKEKETNCVKCIYEKKKEETRNKKRKTTTEKEMPETMK